MRKKSYYDGYMTVEASFVVPLVVMIILLLLYWGFFCYDKTVSIQCSYLAALRTSNQWDLTSSEAEQEALEELEQLTEEKFLFIKRGDLLAKAGILNIETAVTGKMEILFSKIRGDDMTEWQIDSKKSASRLKPASYIRKYRFVGDSEQ